MAATALITSSNAQALSRHNEKALHDFCHKLYKRNEAIRAQWYPNWFETIAMLQDQHYSEWSDTQGLVESPKILGDYVYRAVVNKMIGAHQGLISKTIKSRPRPTVVPLNADSTSIDVVRFMSQLDEYLEIKLDRERVRKEILAWVFACGLGISKSFYDEYAGDNLSTQQILTTDDVDNRAIEDEDLVAAALPIFQRVCQGEIYYGSRSPFEVGFDMSNAIRHASPYYYEHQAYRRDTFREEFSETWRKVQNTTSASDDVQEYYGWRDKMRQFIGERSSFNGYDLYSSPVSKGAFEEEIKVLEIYHEPCQIWPNGLMVKWTPNAKESGILAVDESHWFFTLPDGRRHIYAWHPYTFYEDIHIPGKPLGRSTIESGKPINKMLNRNVSAIQEYVNVAAKQRVFMRKGTGVSRDDFTDRMVDIIEIGNADFKDDIHVAQIPALPSQVSEARDYLKFEFDSVVGQTIEDEGKAVRSNLSGDAIERLDEREQIRMIPKIDNYVAGLCNDSRFHALLAKQHYPQDLSESRYVVIAGRSGRHRVRAFDASLVALDAKFKVLGTSDLTRSVAVKKREAMEMYNALVFGQPGTKEAVRKLVATQEFGNIEGVFEDVTLGESLIHDRLDAILDDQEPPDDGPWPFEDHTLALEEINKWRIKYYGRITPIQRMRVDYLATEHQRLLADKDLMNRDEAVENLQTNPDKMSATQDPTSPADMLTKDSVQMQEA